MSRDGDELTVQLKRESESAWLVEDSEGTEAWLPKSAVEFGPDAMEGAILDLDVPFWLVRKTGLV